MRSAFSVLGIVTALPDPLVGLLGAKKGRTDALALADGSKASEFAVYELNIALCIMKRKLRAFRGMRFELATIKDFAF